MADKKVVQYTSGVFYGYEDIVGRSVTLFTVDHPDFDYHQSTHGVDTSAVVSYDEVTGFIETKNTLYVPAFDFKLQE